MPEGHTVHRIARQIDRDFVGHRLTVTSPQGRFAAGAERLDGRRLVSSRAVGKQLFLGFAPAGEGDVLRVHLGLYGAWDFFGQVTAIVPGVEAVGSMGAPRLRRAVRMGEVERVATHDSGGAAVFPPEPVGQVRVRLATEVSVADLRGPSACEVLDPVAARAAITRLGPDPAGEDDLAAAGEIVVARVTGRAVPIGQLLMDQAVVAGIGNIYRAELLFRARLDPYTPGRRVPAEVVRGLWTDWATLLGDGIREGAIITREDLDAAGRLHARDDRTERTWVYGRAGLPCRVCGAPVAVDQMAGRKLFWCPACQR